MEKDSKANPGALVAWWPREQDASQRMGTCIEARTLSGSFTPLSDPVTQNFNSILFKNLGLEIYICIYYLGIP